MLPLPSVFKAHTLVPVLVVDDGARAAALGRALVNGGLPIAEVTFRTDAAPSAIASMSRVEGLTVGAGTVLNPAQVDAAVEAGARFIVTPGLSETVVRHCQHVGIPVLPGATTATEVIAALDLGISTVKFFPAATAGGPAAISALSAPFPDVKFVPTGGISPSNLRDYLLLDAVIAVGGSWMCPRSCIAEGDFATIERLTRQAVDLTRSIKER